MIRTKGGRPIVPATLLSFAALALGLPPAIQEDTAAEDFEEVDPYTEGDPQRMQDLGVLSFGPFFWSETRTTTDVEQIVGTDEILFVETAHFRLASTLGTYEQGGDKVEKARLREELGRMGRSNRKIKAKIKDRDADPWLRALLYAQRLEDTYAEFVDLFELRADEFPSAPVDPEKPHPMGRGPYLGQVEKFTILLSGNASGYGRYAEAVLGIKDDYMRRWIFSDCMFYGVSFETLRGFERKLDICLHVNVVGSVVLNLLDGFRASEMAVPEWFKYGLAHWFTRRIDSRWNNWGAGGPSVPDMDRQWEWKPRVRGLVANDSEVPWTNMLEWVEFDDLKPRDHMVAWSRVGWLVEEKPKGLRELLMGLTEVLPVEKEERLEASVAQQVKALDAAYGKTAAELDEEWRKFVLRKYPK